jgi:hypothetical protein
MMMCTPSFTTPPSSLAAGFSIMNTSSPAAGSTAQRASSAR